MSRGRFRTVGESIDVAQFLHAELKVCEGVEGVVQSRLRNAVRVDKRPVKAGDAGTTIGSLTPFEEARIGVLAAPTRVLGALDAAQWRPLHRFIR
jgi:hypothetical protein